VAIVHNLVLSLAVIVVAGVLTSTLAGLLTKGYTKRPLAGLVGHHTS